MRRDLRRWSGPGLAAGVLVAGLVVAWLKLNHGLFGALVGFAAVLTLLVAATVNGFRQVSPASLQSRGIYLDDSRLPNYDPGLRRVDWRVLPLGLGRTTYAAAPPRAPARPVRPAGRGRRATRLPRTRPSRWPAKARKRASTSCSPRWTGTWSDSCRSSRRWPRSGR